MMTWTGLPGSGWGPVKGSCGHGNGPLNSMKGVEFSFLDE